MAFVLFFASIVRSMIKGWAIKNYLSRLKSRLTVIQCISIRTKCPKTFITNNLHKIICLTACISLYKYFGLHDLIDIKVYDHFGKNRKGHVFLL